jgi:hypothetical protein
VLLLQTCELGVEFALIFVSHGVLGRKPAMRLRRVPKTISSLSGRSASEFASVADRNRFRPSGRGPILIGQCSISLFDRDLFESRFRMRGGGEGVFGPTVPTHDSLQLTLKYEEAVLDAHRQISGLVYTCCPGSNLRS